MKYQVLEPETLGSIIGATGNPADQAFVPFLLLMSLAFIVAVGHALRVLSLGYQKSGGVTRVFANRRQLLWVAFTPLLYLLALGALSWILHFHTFKSLALAALR